jgi:oxygen-independent coproporphyrinogen-3 oxidase
MVIADRSFALYVHIPYCIYRCPYCDFNVEAVTRAPEERYTNALLAELRHYAQNPIWRGRRVATIYFGGGTPSLFSAQSISTVLDAVRDSFPVEENAEISLEANPCTLSKDLLGGYRSAGVNRLSLGAQSFTPKFLKLLGRSHSAEDIGESVRMARESNFKNISIDVIYALPGQTPDDLKTDLAAACALSPEHISAYTLTIEKGTPFFSSVERGILKPASEETQAEFIEALMEFLKLHSFEHYEISNFARTGFRSRHNSTYWSGGDYLGLGAGAHSFNIEGGSPLTSSAQRRSNFAPPGRYIETALGAGNATSWHDTLNRDDLIFEFFYLGLRRLDGVNLNEFKARFGEDFDSIYGAEFLAPLLESNMLKLHGEILAVTTRGLLLYDSLLESFILQDSGNAVPTP